MAARLFGAPIDYRKVRIFSRRYLPFGLQPRDVAEWRDLLPPFLLLA